MTRKLCVRLCGNFNWSWRSNQDEGKVVFAAFPFRAKNSPMKDEYSQHFIFDFASPATSSQSSWEFSTSSVSSCAEAWFVSLLPSRELHCVHIFHSKYLICLSLEPKGVLKFSDEFSCLSCESDTATLMMGENKKTFDFVAYKKANKPSSCYFDYDVSAFETRNEMLVDAEFCRFVEKCKVTMSSGRCSRPDVHFKAPLMWSRVRRTKKRTEGKNVIQIVT